MIKSFLMVKVGRFLDKANVKTPKFDQFSCSGPPPFFPFITIIIIIIGKANSKTPKIARSLSGFFCSGPPPFSPPILAVTDFFQQFPPAPVPVETALQPVETALRQVVYLVSIKISTLSKPKNHLPRQVGVMYIPPFASHAPTL